MTRDRSRHGLALCIAVLAGCLVAGVASATPPQEKAFFKILASEEQKHFDIIYEYLDFLESSGLRMGE